jgi:inner membrane protein
VPLGDAVKNFTYHRGPSHSLFVLAAFTPLMVHWILKVHPQTVLHRTRWLWLVFLAFTTHVLLDCLTVYGTQVFWPLPPPPVMWSTLFIIDPAYSLPLLAGVLAAVIMSRRTTRGHTVNTACLAISSVYLFWSIGAKIHVESVARVSLERQGIGHSMLLNHPDGVQHAPLARAGDGQRGVCRGLLFASGRKRREILLRINTPARIVWPVSI